MNTAAPPPAPPGPGRAPGRDGLQTARLLEALRAVGSEVELPEVLQHLVEAAVTLVRAGYGALGVLDANGQGLTDFITVGVDEATGDRIGPPPAGLGGLGALLQSPRPLRLQDLSPDVQSTGLHSNHLATGSFLNVPVLVGDAVFGNLYLTNKLDGGAFTDDDEDVLVTLAVAAGVAVRNARLYEQARRGSAWREAGRSISTSLLSGTDRDDVIALLVRTSQTVLSADSVLIALGSGPAVEVAASSGPAAVAEDRALLEGLRPVMLEGEPHSAESGALTGFAVPLGPAGKPCQAVLAALWSTPPNPLLVEDLKGFAAQAAVALELADRRHAAEQGAVLADRDRIGRDLHDLVIQRLFATGMRLQSALRLIPTDPVAATARVDTAVDDLDATIRELRSTIYGLQAPTDGRLSLRARLLEVVDAGTDQLGFAPALRLDGLLDTVVTVEVGEHVLATVREALSNAARHARATQVEVCVVLRGESLRVVVEDDGVGIAPGPHRSGLRNLANRATQVGGSLAVDRGQRGGTRLTWAVAVPPPPATG